MAAPLSQKEYLKKYLSGPNSQKKKKKKRNKDKPPSQTKGYVCTVLYYTGTDV